MRLQGDKIKLRPISDSDTENIVKWRNREFVKKNFFYQELFTKEVHEEWLRTRVDTGEVDQFIITRLDTGEDIGSVYIRDIDTVEGIGEYGIFIGEENSLGLGFGTEAAKLMVEYAGEELRLNKLILRFKEENERAYKSYLSAGFSLTEKREKDAVFMEILL